MHSLSRCVPRVVFVGERFTSTGTGASDVYSYGIVLWQLKERKDPHDGWAPIDILTAVQLREYRPPIPVEWNRELVDLVQRYHVHNYTVMYVTIEIGSH